MQALCQALVVCGLRVLGVEGLEVVGLDLSRSSYWKEL